MRPECVPKAVVGIQDARHNAPIVGTVMQGVALSIYLVELAREDQHAIKAGIEGAHLIVGAAPHANFGQFRVPGLFGLCLHFFEAFTANLLQIHLCLFLANVRSGDVHLYGFAPFQVETHHGSHVLPLLFALAIQQLLVFPDGGIEERAVEGDHEEVFKPRAYAAIVLSRIAHDTPFFRYQPDIRPAIAGIYHHVCTVSAVKLHPECRCTLGGCQLYMGLRIAQIGVIIVRKGNFCFVREPTAAAFFGKVVAPRYGHDR